MLLYDKMDINDPVYAHLFNPLRIRAQRVFANHPQQQQLYLDTYRELFEFDNDVEALLHQYERLGILTRDANGLLQAAQPSVQLALQEAALYIDGQGMRPEQFILPNGLLVDEPETEQQEPEERQGEDDYTTGDGKPMRGAGVWKDIKNWMHKQAYKVLRHHPAFGWLPENPTGSAFRPDRLS